MAPDLSTTYLGLQLSSPLVPSASPLSRNLDTIRRLEDAGAAAIVLHSLFEEQIEFEGHLLDRYLNVSADSSYWEATSYHPEPDDFRLPPEQYLEHLRRAKAAAGIPIIASLEGGSSTRACSSKRAPTRWSSTRTTCPPTNGWPGRVSKKPCWTWCARCAKRSASRWRSS